MSRVFAVDARNDLYVGSDGSLALATGLEAVLQAAQQAAQTQLGEMIYAVDQGVPNFAAVWNGAPNLNQFEAFLRRTLLSVEGVVAILELDVQRRADAVSYRAVIETVFGLGVVNG